MRSERGRSRERKRGGDRGRSREGKRGGDRENGSSSGLRRGRALHWNSGARGWISDRGFQHASIAAKGRGRRGDATYRLEDKRSTTNYVPYERRRSPRLRSDGHRRRQGGARRDNMNGPIHKPSSSMPGRPQDDPLGRLGSTSMQS